MNLQRIFKVYFIFVMVLAFSAMLDYFYDFNGDYPYGYASVSQIGGVSDEGFQLELGGYEGWAYIEKARNFVSVDSKDLEVMKVKVAKNFDIDGLTLIFSGFEVKSAELLSSNNANFKGKVNENSISFSGLDGMREYILHLQFDDLELGNIGKLEIDEIYSKKGVGKRIGGLVTTFSVVR